jgi:kynureninase
MTDFGKTKSAFSIPEGMIYLDGNSLGPLPRAARDAVTNTLQNEWGEMLITGWNRAGWMDQPKQVGDGLRALSARQAAMLLWATRCRSRCIKHWHQRWHCALIAK